MKFATLFLLAASSISSALVFPLPGNVGGHEGIPLPTSAEEFRQPVAIKCGIMQGNGGSFSHTGEHSFYAWDFGIQEGTPVVAARAGVIQRVRMDSNIGGGDRDVFLNDANSIDIDHGDGTMTTYVHLQKNRNLVRLGEFVLQGELLASSGATGFATAAHLHYSVKDSAGKSLPSRFVDFENRDGVPAEGDTVPAARKPAVPQKVIESYKRTFRACVRSDRHGYPDLGFAFAESVPGSARYSDYYYAQVISKKKEKYRTRILSRLKYLTETSEPEAIDFEDASRYLHALSRVKDKEIKAALRDLKPARRAWSSDDARQWTKNGRAIRPWVDGIRAELEEDVSRALKSYSKSLKSAKGSVHPRVVKGLRRAIDGFRTLYLKDLERLHYESKKALGKDRGRVKADADFAWQITREIVDAWSRWFPADEAVANQALEEARNMYQAIVVRVGKAAGN